MSAQTGIARGYVGAAGAQVHYRALGDPEAMPVFWLHQTASSSAMWERVLPLVPGVRHLALDTPGFGASDPLPGSRPGSRPGPTIADYADRMAAAMTALADTPALVVAHHTGAVIAGEIAASRPDLVAGLVVLGTVVVADDAEQTAAQATYERWEIDARGDYVVEHLIPRLLKSVTHDDPAHMESELLSYLQAGPDYVAAYDAVYGYRAAERLPLVTAPTWCYVGDEEAEVMHRWTRLAADLVPGASYATIPGAGCELAFEAPELVVPLVTAALNELARATTPPSGRL